MSSVDRESSRDRELVLKHQPSFSDSGRGSVPMWDSSDPDRAPPPLPLNPGSSSPVTKSNASANVVAAAEALAAKGRENTYTTNPLPNKSPEKSLIKGQYHKRMQSLQSSNVGVKDLSNYLENSRSPDRSLERQSRSHFDFENRSPERSPTRSGTPTPTSRDLGKDVPNLRPSSRPGLKAILGETPPQSATMRALQGTPTNENDPPLSNITNSSTALVRTPQTMDIISNQILGLTNIATRLQQEMAALSRRSKDNATDLVSLKDATNARDEDIRTSLKNLVSGLANKIPELEARSHLGRGPGSYLLEERSASSPSLPKTVSLPRIPSPASFSASIDREIAGSPNPYSMDGGASIALLEKVMRDMGTKEGQDKLLDAIAELATKPNTSVADSRIGKHLEEVIGLLKDQSSSRALVRTNNGLGDGPPQLNSKFENPGQLGVAEARNMTPRGQSNSPRGPGPQQPFSSPRAADFVSDDILKLLKRMKDSISEGGGMSAEIKALVRELRGEVLGMGREIGRKLDQAESIDRSDTRQDAQGPGREEISKIVEEGLADLKEHMDRVMKEHRRQSSSSMVSRSTVDNQEVYHAVKNALQELHVPQPLAVQQQGSGIEREEILEAVREAWETYKPEIELQNFGLERDEILQCLREGLEEYKPQEQDSRTYEEVCDAVKDGLRDFKPPPPIESEATITKEEILMTVRECLETFEFPIAAGSRESEIDMTRDDVLDAVKEGLSLQTPMAKDFELNREDLFDAVKAGLEGVPIGGVGVEVMAKMQDLIDGMRGEFQQYSAANGRDTEQVLDAMKDGLEVLRTSIETYVDRAADVTGKDEIIETVRNCMEKLQEDLESTIANAPRPTAGTASGELLDVMEKEFEHLRSTILSSVVRGEESSVGREELLDAIRDGFDDIKDSLPSHKPNADPEMLSSVQQELQHLRETLASTLTRGSDGLDREELLETIKEGIDKAQLGLSKDNGRPESILSNTSELLDHFNEGLDNLKIDVERIVNKPIDMTVNYEILETLKEGLANVRADLDSLRDNRPDSESAGTKRGGEIVVADEDAVRGLQRPDIENLEVMITQLKIKVESLDNMPPPPASQAPEESIIKSDFEHLESMMKETQESVAALLDREQMQQDNGVTKEDTDAIETLLRNTMAHIEDMAFPEPENMARTEHIDVIETMLKNTKDAVEDLAVKQENDSASKEDIVTIEIILKDVQNSLQEMREKTGDEPITKSDVEALATLCTENQAQFKGILPEGKKLPTRDDVENLRDLVQEFQDKFDADAEMTAQAFDARKTEHGGLADKIEDVKAFLDSVRADLKAKLDTSDQGIQELATSLEAIGEVVTSSSSSTTASELKEILEREFEKSHSNHEAATADLEQYKDVVIGKHDDHKAAIVDDLTAKIDARFDEMMTKYDDAQLAADAKAIAFEEKANEQAEAVSSARAVTDDLKVLVDTLGVTVTESCDRMGEDTRTVFTKVDDIGGKVDETLQLTVDGKADHQLTRAEISKTMVAVESLHAHTSEYNPKIMSAITDVLNIVGQHYEEAQKSSEEIKTSVNAIPNSIPIPALPAPQEPAIERLPSPPAEKYDDSEVQAKLDQLVSFATAAGKSAAQFEMLEQIKNQVTTTASEFQSFMNAQQATIMDMQESRAREAEEVNVALEKRTAQKEVVEADIVRLSDERSQLEASVEGLKSEEKQLASLKAKLQADVSSLEMALVIRREEMGLMETRAHGLERRILDGVLDHSRSLLINSRPQPSLNKSMNLKRVPSTASSNATVTTNKGFTTSKVAPSNASSAVSSAIGMAMKKRQPNLGTADSSTPASKGNRRILSLSTIGVNKGVAGDRSIILTSPSMTSGKNSIAFGGGGLKRSHSVKSNFPVRKTSWGGTKQIGMFGDDPEENDKENNVLEEEEEEESERGTDGRTSYTGTYTGTEESYESGSVTDSTDDRRTSYAASTVGTVGGTHAEEEEAHHDSEGSETGAEGQGNEIQLYQGDLVNTKDSPEESDQIVRYGMTDSGLGSELPTAALDAGINFFRD